MNENYRPGLAKRDEEHVGALHPAWLAFLRFCAELKYGEIERLSIQNGLPVLAEMTKKKIKFTNG
ncbi:MAG: hypothetical protein JWO48_3787 [Bryobacterales bacterium]|nr:hypothetical protein [Bryobacterales bacterium]